MNDITFFGVNYKNALINVLPQLEVKITNLVQLCVVDDESNISVMRLENSLHFPESPVNITSIACLADTYNDDHGTFIKTSRFSSEFSWNFGKHVKTIYHTDSHIP